VDVDRVVGTEVAGYAIEAVRGRGAMGVVYLASQSSPARKVALKLIAPAIADDEGFRSRFLREASAAAAIDHPHVLPVFDAGEADGTLFIAMRLVDGQDLRQLLRELGTLPPKRAASIAGQVAGALDAAHARRLVHRDVKPGNILVAPTGDPEDPDFCYLTDFGVSTWTASTGTLTSAGHLVGTLNYAAPEQIEGTGVDGQADQYSLGCVVFECLTGRAPFAGRSPPGILHAHLHEEPPTPSSLRPDLPAALDVPVARSLRKDPRRRYESCRAFASALREAPAIPARGTSPAITPRARRVAEDGQRDVPGRRRVAARTLAIAGSAALATLVVVLASLAVADRRGGGDARSGSPGTAAGAPVRIRTGVQVIASSTAPSSVDGAGNLVTYQPANVVDGDVQTAWRAPGNGRGITLTLLFDGPIDVDRVGLIPGYAKTDPETGIDRFVEDRIVSKVRYLMPSLPPITKTFRPLPLPQYVEVHAVTSRITVRILRTTKSGGKDFTAISEIYVYGFPP